MTKLIVIISTQCPGNGGASTNAYALIRYLRSKAYKVIGIFLEDNPRAIADPDNIKMVHKLALYPFTHKFTPQIIAYRKMLAFYGKPYLTLCKNYLAPICSKLLYPQTKIIYLISGLTSVIDHCSQYPANQWLTNNIHLPGHQTEEIAMELSDIVVTNSDLTFQLFKKIYPQFKRLYPKPVNTSYLTFVPPTLIPMKTIDIVVAASDLIRLEKNNYFLMDILATDLAHYTKIIVGNNSQLFQKIPNTIIKPLLPHPQFIELLLQCKVYLCASLYDSNPNTVVEAYYCACSVLVSNNIGYCKNLPAHWVCDSFDRQEWIDKTSYLVDHFVLTHPKTLPQTDDNLNHLLTQI